MIGERLSEIRKDHGDTQADLARYLGVSLPTVRAWEQEISSPNHKTLVSICRLYHVSADYLLGLSDVDPAYIQSRRLDRLSNEDLLCLKEFEDYLVWKRTVRPKVTL